MFESYFSDPKKIKKIRVDRVEFLKTVFKDDIEELEDRNRSMRSDYSMEQIRKRKVISKSIIKDEMNEKNILSKLDLEGYYEHTFSFIQKLLYLYGLKENIFDDIENITGYTDIIMKVTAGVMFGIEGAEKLFSDIMVCNGGLYCAKECIDHEKKKQVNQIQESIKGKILSDFVSGVAIGIGIFSVTDAKSRCIKRAEKLQKYLEKFCIDSMFNGRRITRGQAYMVKLIMQDLYRQERISGFDCFVVVRNIYEFGVDGVRPYMLVMCHCAEAVLAREKPEEYEIKEREEWCRKKYGVFDRNRILKEVEIMEDGVECIDDETLKNIIKHAACMYEYSDYHY